MPGFWSCGFIPRPSSGRKSRRANGFALKHVVAMKNSRIAESVPVAHGIELAIARSRLVAMAIVEYIDRINAQKSIDPAWPLQNAVKMYTFGMFELMWPATYSSEKSRDSSAVQSPIDASNDHRERGVQSANAAVDQFVAAQRAAGERHGRRPGRHQQRDPERQLTDEDHARPRSRLVARRSACISGRRRVLVARRALGEQLGRLERAVVAHASADDDVDAVGERVGRDAAVDDRERVAAVGDPERVLLAARHRVRWSRARRARRPSRRHS